MTILSELVKRAASVADVQSRLNRHRDLVKKFVQRRRVIGTATGAVAGGVGLGAAQHSANKSKDKARHGSVGASAVAGALSGGFLGHEVGMLSAGRRAFKSMGRAQRHTSSWNARFNRARAGANAGGSASRKAGGHPFWDKVPEAVRHKAKGVATHAKRTAGPEGEAARNVLKNMGKKHGFDPDMAVKHANTKTAISREIIERAKQKHLQNERNAAPGAEQDAASLRRLKFLRTMKRHERVMRPQ